MKKTLMVSALLLVMAAPALGNPVGTCSSTSFIAITTPAATFYIDDRGGNPPIGEHQEVVIPENPILNGYITNHREGFIFGSGLWIYQESNGVAGLQRGGGSVLNPLGIPVITPDNEIAECNTPTPDTLIF